MMMIECELLGNVSFEVKDDSYIKYKYDVQFDNLGMPYITLHRISPDLKYYLDDEQNITLYPDGYFGMIKAFGFLSKKYPDAKMLIREHFTDQAFDKEGGYRIRSLKAGQKFRGLINPKEGKTKELARTLSEIKSIGVSLGNVTGSVKLKLMDAYFAQNDPGSYDKRSFDSLEYSIMLLSPACINAPYDVHAKTLSYLPGSIMREELAKKMDISGMIFSHAYISDSGVRLLPVPCCGSLVKLDKSQYRYRLAPGKDYTIVEQDTDMGGFYSADPTGRCITYTAPKTEHINVNEYVCDALSEGQIFSGTIYGNDEQVRQAYEILGNMPFMRIGDFKKKGYGCGVLQIGRMNETEIKAPYYAKEFDLVCLSDTLIINDEGMPSCNPYDLLKEVEYCLGISDYLEIAGMYMDTAYDHSTDHKWGQERECIRCIGKGSVLRIKTKDDGFLDISPLRRGFIGERNSEGYGEISFYPAKGEYYRTAVEKLPELYDMDIHLTYRTVVIGMKALSDVITEILKDRIRELAHNDREDYLNGISADKLIPKELLNIMREWYNPFLTQETVTDWYKKELEGEDNV